MKKGFIRGVVTCDPSWRGLAFTIHIPSLSYNDSVVMDLSLLLTNKKTLLQPMTYIPLVVQAIDTLIRKRPAIRLCDKLVIETQFKDNMKNLSTVIVSVIQTRLPYIKVEKLSALKCKRTHGVSYGKGNQDNKKNMLTYVTENKDKLIAGDTVKDHNTADSIIILNTWVTLKNRHFYKTPEEYALTMEEIHYDVPFDLKKAFYVCPNCEAPEGKVFLCKNPPKEGKRDYRGYFIVSCKLGCGPGGVCFLSKKIPPMNVVLGDDYKGKWKPISQEDRIKLNREREAKGLPTINTVSSKSDQGYQGGATYPGAYNTIPVQPLSDGHISGNPLEGIVESLEKKQSDLAQTVSQMKLDLQNTLEKFLEAVGTSKSEMRKEITRTGTVIVEEEDEEKVTGNKRKRQVPAKAPPAKKKLKSFKADDLEDGPEIN